MTTAAAGFTADNDINDFDDFIQKLKGTKRSEPAHSPAPVKKPLQAAPEVVRINTESEHAFPEPEDDPCAFGGDEIFIKSVSHVSFHQKIRRAFVANGPFRYDGQRRDISIEQEGDILKIFVDVSMSSDAKEKAVSIWNAILKRIADADWSVDLNDVVYIDDEEKVFILFASEKLVKHPTHTKR